MAMDATKEGIINNSEAANQKAATGTELKSVYDDLAEVKTGVGITLPTSDPSSAGALWSDSGTVKVSAG